MKFLIGNALSSAVAEGLRQSAIVRSMSEIISAVEEVRVQVRPLPIGDASTPSREA